MPRKLTSKKRGDLMAAAIKVFKKKGYREASVKEIVAEAGSSTATFYRYFKSKDDLYGEIVMGFLSGFVTTWSKAYNMLTEKAGSKEEALAMMAETFRSVLEYYRYNRDIAQIVFRGVLPIDEKFMAQGDLLVNTTIDQLEEVLEAMESNDIARNIEPRVGAAITIGAVFGVAITCVIQERRDDVGTLTDQMMEIVEHGITGT